MHAAFQAGLAEELGLVLRLLAQLQGDACPAKVKHGDGRHRAACELRAVRCALALHTAHTMQALVAMARRQLCLSMHELNNHAQC